jgi:MiaB/RimO family radical SAM methylthiotransferase
MDYKIFWCKVNKYYTDKWLNSKQLEWKTGIFIASCVVTDNAKRKWLKFVKDTAKLLKNNEKLYISWCWAFKDWKAQVDFFELYPEINYLKEDIIILWEDPKEKLENKIKSIPQLYTKKFVLIQWGCDSFCTYCLTVKKRWRHFSRKKEEILKEILNFEQNWWKEVVLTWINLSAWWLDSTNDVWKSRFAELLNYLLDNSNIPRIRISSIWPEFITDEVLEIFKNTRIYPHFHYSIQSWSTNILKSMSRHYDGEYIKKLLLKTSKIKRDDLVKISLWADIIVGFPWETNEDFNKSLDLIQDCNITKVHSFPFSSHTLWENVPAWKFNDQIDEKTKKSRMNKILKLSETIRNNFILENQWKTLKVLIEFNKDWEWKWWTQNYIEANNKNFQILSWKIGRNEIVTWFLTK